jgi:quercetin dioxygenase-like cupin family protein
VKTRRRELFALPLAVFPLAAAAKLPDVTRTAAEAAVTQEPFGEIRVYFDGPTDQLKAMTAGSLRLKPGMSPHPPHQHEEEEIMVITEGTGEISIDGKVTKVAPGTMMYCGANKPHGIVNTGKSYLLFYYYKWKGR